MWDAKTSLYCAPEIDLTMLTDAGNESSNASTNDQTINGRWNTSMYEWNRTVTCYTFRLIRFCYYFLAANISELWLTIVLLSHASINKKVHIQTLAISYLLKIGRFVWNALPIYQWHVLVSRKFQYCAECVNYTDIFKKLCFIFAIHDRSFCLSAE